MDRRRWLRSSLATAASLALPPGVLALAGCGGTAREAALHAFDGRIMGTGYGVRLGDRPSAGLPARVLAELGDVDARMSTWREDSELARFNASADTDWQPLSASTVRVVAEASRVAAASDGGFDASVGPLVDLWGFGPRAGSTGRVGGRPRDAEIRRTLARIGHALVDVDVANGAVRKRSASLGLDLSGIAKGHAVDRVSGLLDAEGHGSHLVEIGGEIRARGAKPDGTPWRVAIERPGGGRDAFRVIELADRAVATSGDYRHYFESGGRRYSHAIDPRTGRPVTHALASVSVVARSTMAADALSTALMILGPDAGMAFAERHGVAAHMILGGGGPLAERWSPAFDALAA